MYEQDTILVLKEQREADSETGEEFAYNRVCVKGPSPVSHADKGDWTGPDAKGVIIVPLSNFGGTLDEPFGKLKSLYEVESIPEREITPPSVRVVNATTAAAGPTPEEVFSKEAPGVPKEVSRARRRPLGDPGGPSSVDPLD